MDNTAGDMDEDNSRFLEIYERSTIEDWRPYYVNFRDLLEKLVRFTEQYPDPSDELKKEFAKRYARKLSFQIERVNYHATKIAGHISNLLNIDLMQMKDPVGRLSDESLRTLFESDEPEGRLEMIRGFHQDFTDCGEEVKRLMNYLDSNLRAIHKLRTIVPSLLGEVRAFPNISLLMERQIAGRNQAFDLGNIIDALNKIPVPREGEVQTIANLIEDREQRSAEIALSSSQFHLRLLRKCDHVKFIAGFINTLARVLDRLSIAEEGLLLKISDKNEIHAAESGVLRIRGDRLIRQLISTKNLTVNRALTLQRLISAESGVFMVDTYESPEEMERKSQLPRANMWLNLLSTLLYLISMYAPLSTAGKYAEKLKVSQQWFGFILASTPFAGFVSAPLWSWAANKSFKTPLLISSFVCLLGNLIYALAQSYASIKVALIGRILVGFGGARAVNRRYIADNVSKSEQPIQSYYFVVASALGMPLGPFLSIVANIPPDFELDFPGLPLYFNDYTNSAWLLVVIWVSYMFLLSKYFQEPDRNRDSSGATGTKDETTNLLNGDARKKEKSDPNVFEQFAGLFRNPVILFLLFLYFVIKLACEIAISGAAFYLPHIFQWGTFSTSVYLTVLGILMVLITPIVRKILESDESDDSDDALDKDRNVLAPSLVLACIGCSLGLPLFGSAQVSIQVLLLVTATTIIFVSTNAAESCTMSVLRRTSPTVLLDGMWNTSLLATISGMMGRAVADAIIYFAADAKSEEAKFFTVPETQTFFWVAFLPCVAACILCLFGLYAFWSTMSNIRSSADQGTEIRDALHYQSSYVFQNYDEDTDDFGFGTE